MERLASRSSSSSCCFLSLSACNSSRHFFTTPLRWTTYPEFLGSFSNLWLPLDQPLFLFARFLRSPFGRSSHLSSSSSSLSFLLSCERTPSMRVKSRGCVRRVRSARPRVSIPPAREPETKPGAFRVQLGTFLQSNARFSQSTHRIRVEGRREGRPSVVNPL